MTNLTNETGGSDDTNTTRVGTEPESDHIGSLEMGDSKAPDSLSFANKLVEGLLIAQAKALTEETTHLHPRRIFK